MLDAGRDPGQSLAMGPLRRNAARWLALAGFALALGQGCTDKSAPEYVADQFVDAYFRRMDQQAARQFTALGATETLDRELDLVRSVRAEGYGPDQAASEVVVRRAAKGTRGDRVRFDYDITIKHDEADERRAADVELAKIQTQWKVVRFDVKPRA